jgi:hypothetical protein
MTWTHAKTLMNPENIKLSEESQSPKVIQDSISVKCPEEANQ